MPIFENHLLFSIYYFQIFNNNTTTINYDTVLKIAYNEPYVRTNTDTNFFQIINYTYTLMSFLYGTSRKLLLGLETGLSKKFIETFFPRDRQLYYYNLYTKFKKIELHTLDLSTHLYVLTYNNVLYKLIPSISATCVCNNVCKVVIHSNNLEIFELE